MLPETYIPLDDAFDAHHYDAAGNPVPDNVVSTQYGRRAVASDDRLVEGHLALPDLGDADGLMASWTVSYDPNVILLWTENDDGTLRPLAAGVASPWEPVASASGTSVDFWVQGMAGTTADLTATLTVANGPGDADPAVATAELTVAVVPTDISWEASVPAEPPDRPAQVIPVNDGDSNDNGIPDFADGYGKDYGNGHVAATQADGVGFVPVYLTLPTDVDPDTTQVTISYDASDPNGVQLTGSGTDEDPHVYTPASGTLRLWTRDASHERSAEAFDTQEYSDEVGYYVPAGTYTLSTLYDRCNNGVAGTIVLYAEAVREIGGSGGASLVAGAATTTATTAAIGPSTAPSTQPATPISAVTQPATGPAVASQVKVSPVKRSVQLNIKATNSMSLVANDRATGGGYGILDVSGQVDADPAPGTRTNIGGFKGTWSITAGAAFWLDFTPAWWLSPNVGAYEWEQRAREPNQNWRPDGHGTRPGILAGYQTVEDGPPTSFPQMARTDDYPQHYKLYSGYGYGVPSSFTLWGETVLVVTQGAWVGRILAEVDWKVTWDSTTLVGTLRMSGATAL